ncbi:MAG: zinc-binding dehydrogenase [Bdellovibrionales bacterium]|nr:zinc-binding dehydrogenase [Bdellovibrionales bacterium]
MKALYFKQHGGSEHLEYGEVAVPNLREGWARIRVLAVALNHLDIWIRRGWPGLSLPLPHITGADICGELVATSGDASSISIGERVVVYPGIVGAEDEFVRRGEPSVSPDYQVLGEHVWGGLAEFVDVPLANLRVARSDLSVEDSAAPNLVVTTAWRMLFTRGQLESGESLLVVGSGGGVNVASMLIGKAIGARVIVLAGGAEKSNRVRTLGFTEVVDYLEVPDWHREIMKHTGGRGVDVVVDNVGRETFAKSLKSLRRGGRLLTVGNTSGYNVEIDNRLVFGKQLSIVGSTMGSIEDWEAGLNLIAKHKITLPIDRVYSLSEGKIALERLEQGRQFGKIILKPDSN